MTKTHESAALPFSRLTSLAAATLAVLAGAGCSDGGGSSGGGPGGPGSLTLLATDAPFAHDIVAEASITITEVRIHRESDAESGFETLYDGDPIEFDLLELQDGVTRELFRVDLPAGTYRQLRLVLSDARLELENGNVYSTDDDTLKFTSQATSGFKIFIDPPLEIVTDLAATVLLDFDLTKTFHPIPANDAENATRYQLQPVIHVANLSETGVLRGRVTRDDGVGSQVPVDGATVYVLQPGELDLANSLRTTGTRPTGGYALLGLEPGAYDVVAVQGAEQGRVNGQQVFAGNTTVVDVEIE
jgi:hypothetical protein